MDQEGSGSMPPGHGGRGALGPVDAPSDGIRAATLSLLRVTRKS